MIKFKNTFRSLFILIMIGIFTSTLQASGLLTANAGADINYTVTASNRAVHLVGTATPNDNIVKYEWFNGTTFIGTGASRWYVLTEDGTHTLTLKVTDAEGNIATDTMVVNVNHQNTTNTGTLTANAGADITHNVIASNRQIYLNGTTTVGSSPIVKQEWFKDGVKVWNGSSAWYTLVTPGEYNFEFRVTAKDGSVVSDTMIVTVIVDNTPPIFTSNPTVTVPENQTSALTVSATTDTTAITYSISGGDSAEFSIDASTGVITFNNAPDFETRTTYTFTVTATDAYGNASTQEITINISDVPEGQAPKKTGQTKSYDASGNEVTDGSIKDDGFYQKGTTPSYTRDDATNIVTDHITGLQWQDNVEAKTVTKNWTDAQSYYSSLSLDGGGWRLPSIDELMYIADRSKLIPAIDTTYFQNVASIYYWSSTTVVGYEVVAWDVRFRNGYDGWSSKSSSNFVRCVRGGQ